MPNAPYLYRGLFDSAKAVQRLIQAIPADQYDRRTEPDRFTLREAIAHLADWEPVMRGRIQACVQAPGSEVKDWDEEQMAIDNDYASQDPLKNTQTLLEERVKTIDFIKSLSEEQWAGTCIHPVRGEMSAYDWANTTLGHDAYHIEHFTQFLTETNPS